MDTREVWKPIEKYEGVYEVSNLGRVRNVTSGKVKIPQNNGNGYKKLFLYRNGKGKSFFVHRLVAKAFVENPDNKPVVNHIDEDRSNNIATNLEWVTQRENVMHGSSPQKMRAGVMRLWESNPYFKCKPVRCVETGTVYPGFKYAAEDTGANPNNIKKCIKGERHTAGGFHWEWA